MARSPIRKPYLAVPRGRFRLGPLLWILLLSGVFAVLYIVAAEAVGKLRFPSSQVFLGSMSAGAKPVAVSLPQGGAVQEFLVETGQDIRKGQTLFSLDQEVLSIDLEDQQRQHLDQQALLSCLLRDPPSGSNITSVAGAAPRDTNPSGAGHACHKLRFEENLIEEEFIAIERKISQEIALIETYLNQVTPRLSRRAADEVSTETLDRFLALSLTKSSLEETLRQAELDHNRQMASLAQDRADLLASTQDILRESQAGIRRLQALLAKPRVHAPISGKIMRLRRIPLGASVAHATEVLSILPQREVGYSVTFDLPEAVHHFAQIDRPIDIETLGLPGFNQRLSATIRAISPSADTPEILRVRADLDTTAAQVLAQSPYSRQILANDSAVSVRLKGRDIDLVAHGQQIVMQELVVDHSSPLSGILNGYAFLRDRAQEMARLDRLPLAPGAP